MNRINYNSTLASSNNLLFDFLNQNQSGYDENGQNNPPQLLRKGFGYEDESTGSCIPHMGKKIIRRHYFLWINYKSEIVGYDRRCL